MKRTLGPRRDVYKGKQIPICSPYTVYKKRIEDEIAQEKAEKTGRMFIARPLSPSLPPAPRRPLSLKFTGERAFHPDAAAAQSC